MFRVAIAKLVEDWARRHFQQLGARAVHAALDITLLWDTYLLTDVFTILAKARFCKAFRVA
jgi:hypothetical protein